MTMTFQDAVLRQLRVLVWATVLLYVLVFFVIGAVYVDSQHKSKALARETTSTTSALCSLRGGLESQVRASNAYLQNHPNGIPGIPKATIRSAIANEEVTIRALADLNC